MNFDEDSVALFLIGFLAVVFVGAAWQKGEVLGLASGIMEFGLGAIAGYMSRINRSQPEDRRRMQELSEENHQLREKIQHQRHLRSQMQNLPEDEL